MLKSEINIVWLKRDLRINNHAALHASEQSHLPYLIIFLFEPDIINYNDTSLRHLQFQYHSVLAMNIDLKKHDQAVHICYGKAIDIFEHLNLLYLIKNLYSYQESGIQITYDRDIAINNWCKKNKITWQEFQRDGIIRGIKNRIGWDKAWHTTMAQPLIEYDFDKGKIVKFINNFKLPTKLVQELNNYDKQMQPPGEATAWKYLNSFLKERHVNYTKHISKPLPSRISCSRLSPYIAWGNISIHQVVLAAQAAKPNANKFALAGFLSRIKWHCHFIQKFEQACSYETAYINKGYAELAFTKNDELIKAWENGTTGYPLVDACMRCVKATGWLNFRMRAMVVSFFCHQLLQDWRWASYYLAQQFLDYEPGIHYTQFQMQAGTTGVNTIRIYNPIKQSIEQDTDGIFIKQWLPELKEVTTEYIHEPWLMDIEKQKNTNCIIGKNYPAPIIDYTIATKAAKDLYWSMRKNTTVKEESKRIVQTHTRPDVKNNDRTKKIKPKNQKIAQLKLL